MTSKTELQSKIQELEAELEAELQSKIQELEAKLEAEFQSSKEQLNLLVLTQIHQLYNYKEITLEAASVGDVLEDGSIVLQKSEGLALLVAPASTEVECQWSEKFPEVFDKLKEQGFNPSQWFVPTQEQLRLAYNFIYPHHFDADTYWSSTEFNTTRARVVNYGIGNPGNFGKEARCRVRAFRCMTY